MDLKANYMLTANPNNGAKPTSLAALVSNFKRNFLQKNIEIVPGLTFNQYETVKRIYFYVHNQFMSGPTDENGDPKYFYDLVTYRNDQSTKSIDLDTKDVYIKSETEGSYLKTWLLRREFVGYAKTSGFGKKLNKVADDLPDFGSVVWKKIKNEEGRTDTASVELINLMNDPSVECLKDGIVIERHLMTQYEMKSMKSWNQDNVDTLIKGGKTVHAVPFMDTTDSTTQAPRTNSVIDETTPYYELYELWGEIPKDLYKISQTGGKNKNTVNTDYSYGVSDAKPASDAVSASYISSNETVYVMAVVGGIAAGETQSVMFCKEVDRSMFPYKEVHYRKKKGRWLGVGNYEACFDLIEKANELTNRFFSSLRIALLHLYQTRDAGYVKNLTQDLIDGDVVVNKSDISVIPTEVRGFTQYKDELDRIEQQADKICNSFEIVTGANLPSGTPFKLGSQQLQTATKLFDYIKQNMGIFLEEVFNEWLLPDFAAAMNKEHVLDLLDDADDLDIYYNAVKKIYQYQALKMYILETNDLPDPAQLEIVGQLVADQFKKGAKQIKVLENYFGNQKYSIKAVITGENDAVSKNMDTLSSLVQVAMANPSGLQDPRLMKLVNIILEQSGLSPLSINAINQTPTNPELNPGNQGGATAAKQAPAGGPGDAAATAAASAGKTAAPVGA